MMSLKSRTAIGVPILLAVVLFFAFNAIVERLGGRATVDLTEDGLFTISESTKKLLASLDQPVEVTFYFSEDAAREYPQLFAYGRRVRDMLKAYAELSGGRIRLTILDPEPFSKEEDEAMGAGLKSFTTPDGRKIYLGLVVRDMTDREAVIPFFDPQREDLLEYDLTKIINNVALGRRATVALLTSLPMKPRGLPGFSENSNPGWAIYDQLRQFFTIEDLSPGFRKIPKGTDILVIIHPPKLDDTQLYLIDQFILKGGRAVIFLDPFSEASVNRPSGQMPGLVPIASETTLSRLFAVWGVEIVPEKIVADRQLAQRVTTGGIGPDAIKNYPVWLRVDHAHMAADDPITANLQTVNLASVGAIRLKKDSPLKEEVLLRSSTDSMLVAANLGRGIPDIDSYWREEFKPDPESYALLVRLDGIVDTAFPDGPPYARDKEDGDAAGKEAKKEKADRKAPGQAAEDKGRSATAGKDDPQGKGGTAPKEADAKADKAKTAATGHLARSTGPIHVVLGADSDLFDDRFWIQVQNVLGRRVSVPMADNGALLLNAIDNLAGSEALIGLRGRRVKDRPFVVVENLRRRAEARLLEEERRLEDELERTQQRLDQLESQKPKGGGVLTPEQEQEIERFRARVLEIRQQLRAVQHELVADIERLKIRLAVINILLVPALLVLLALAAAILRRRRQTTH
ncbi:MAG: hypothetical protein D6740_09385 [Alphaproteobacteria bacterium]|nr:MAG: hypothetical protein D6740_09385 [Alphaproteobacteria bacterium]